MVICSPPCPLKHLVKTQQVTTSNFSEIKKFSPYRNTVNLEAILSSSLFTKIFRKLQIMPWSTYSIFLSHCFWESNCHEYLQIHIFIKPGTGSWKFWSYCFQFILFPHPSHIVSTSLPYCFHILHILLSYYSHMVFIKVKI